MSQVKKTMRHFYCRDSLWEMFEQIANDRDCSIDHLVNEAMEAYSNGQYGGGQKYEPPPSDSSGLIDGDLSGKSLPPPPPATRPRKVTGRTAALSATPTLFLIYAGQRYPVAKDQFIIGRGSKSSDLAIKDGNISRKHAAVIRRNGTYYIKDLGSTNGVDYKGMRIDNKRIDEGDVFHICDYELRFTYRAD